MPAPFVWNGTTIQSIGDLLDALGALESQKEAREFMDTMRVVNPNARGDVGYVLAYLDDPEKVNRLFKWCDAQHPVFGQLPASAEEAMRLGDAAASRRDPRRRN